MKAVLLKQYGGVEQFAYEDVPTPVPGPAQVLVRVISTSINPIDFKIRSGAMKDIMPLQLPVILGRDVAGEVVRTGNEVSGFRQGDHVLGLVNASYAEFLTADFGVLTKAPAGLDMNNAGILPLVAITGAQLIEAGVKPKAGETILITGAAGSVGRVAVFVAKQHGAIVIAGVKSTQKNSSAALGADRVVALDNDDELQKLPELDAIADTVGGATAGKLFAKLKKSGRLATVLGSPAGATEAGIDVREVWAKPDPQRLHELAEAFRDGSLKIPLAKRVTLREIQEAHKAAEKGAAGKIAVIP